MPGGLTVGGVVAGAWPQAINGHDDRGRQRAQEGRPVQARSRQREPESGPAQLLLSLFHLHGVGRQQRIGRGGQLRRTEAVGQLAPPAAREAMLQARLR